MNKWMNFHLTAINIYGILYQDQMEEAPMSLPTNSADRYIFLQTQESFL